MLIFGGHDEFDETNEADGGQKHEIHTTAFIFLILLLQGKGMASPTPNRICYCQKNKLHIS